MNRIAHILAAAFGAALAVACAATFSPKPSPAWALWVLAGGAVGYLAQNPRAVLLEAARLARSVWKLALRHLRQTWRRAGVFHPLWARSALAALRPNVFTVIALLLTAIPTIGMDEVRSSPGYPSSLIVKLILPGALFSAGAFFWWLASGLVEESLLDFRHAPRACDEVVRWGETDPLAGKLWLHKEKWLLDRLRKRHARRALARMTFGEIARSVVWCWVALCLRVARIVAVVACLCVVLRVAVRYPLWVAAIAASGLVGFFGKALLRGAGRMLLVSACRLHSQTRLVAGAGATLGAIAGLALSFAGNFLGAPLLAALAGALCGAFCGWVLAAGSARAVARFGVASA